MRAQKNIEIRPSMVDPVTLQMIGRSYDEAWASVAGNFGNDTAATEYARQLLAKVMLELASEGLRDAKLKSSALQTVARSLAKSRKRRSSTPGDSRPANESPAAGRPSSQR